MTTPELGPCVCDDEQRLEERRNGRAYDEADYRPHEHSDFEPYACADCGCDGHRPAAGPKRAEKPVEPPERRGLTVPAELLDFARQRVTDTAQHVDQIIVQTAGTFTDPDDPLAVCNLADILEQTWPDQADSWAALALTIRRLLDATNHGQPAHRRTLAALRRKVQR